MKTVLITGSNRGLGKELALLFAIKGYDIILHGRDKDRLREVENNLHNISLGLKNKIEWETVAGDLLLLDTINKLYRAAEKRSVDILINNAGIYASKPFKDMDIEEAENIIYVNLIVPIWLTKRIYPIFLKKKSGLIININSIAGKNPNDKEAVYCASKHGLRGFTSSFQFEAMKNNVRVISIYLGAMRSSMTEGRGDPEKLIQPEEAANGIYGICENYKSFRISEIDLWRME